MAAARRRALEEPQWLQPYMMRWADAVVRLAAEQGADGRMAAIASDDLWRRVLAMRLDEPPRPGRLLVAAVDAAGRRLQEAGLRADSRWDFVRRVRPKDREALWLGVYGTYPLEDLAVENVSSTGDFVASLGRAWAASGAAGAPPANAEGWGAWLESLRPPRDGPIARFDWAAWNPAADPFPRPRLAPARRRLYQRLGGAAVLALAALVTVVRLTTVPLPPAPFPLAASSQPLYLLVMGGPPLREGAFGWGPGPALTAVRTPLLPSVLRRYQGATLSAAAPGQSYQLGSLEFAVQEHGGESALIFYGKAPGSITLLSAGGKVLRPSAGRSGYTVYRVGSRAATVRIQDAGHRVVLAWSPAASPRRAIALYGAVWDSAAKPARGFDGSLVFDAPTGQAVTPIAMLRDGVLATAGNTYWLLPAKGPAVPVFRFAPTFRGEMPLVVATPYPGRTNELLVSGPSGGGSVRWWNLATDTWGRTRLSNAVAGAVSSTASGWVASSPGSMAYSYGSPPAAYHLPNNVSVVAAWDDRVLVDKLTSKGFVVGTGVYDWKTGRYSPFPAGAGNGQTVAFPVWGPTAVTVEVGQGIFSFGTEVGGPGVISLARAVGGAPVSMPLPAADVLWAGPRWLVMETGLNSARVGWPGPHGHLRWHTVSGPIGSTLSIMDGALFWTGPTGRHVYVWLPPFAR